MFKDLTRKQAYALWLTALRSGKYRQGRGHLKMAATSGGAKHEYCCLGVACQVFASNNKSLKWSPNCGGMFFFLDSSINLSDKILSFLGLSPANQSTLVDLNDGKGKSLNEIANYIEFILMPKALARPLNYRIRRYPSTKVAAYNV